jgi:hypothetical protein
MTGIFLLLLFPPLIVFINLLSGNPDNLCSWWFPAIYSDINDFPLSSLPVTNSPSLQTERGWFENRIRAGKDKF